MGMQNRTTSLLFHAASLIPTVTLPASPYHWYFLVPRHNRLTMWSELWVHLVSSWSYNPVSRMQRGSHTEYLLKVSSV